MLGWNVGNVLEGLPGSGGQGSEGHGRGDLVSDGMLLTGGEAAAAYSDVGKFRLAMHDAGEVVMAEVQHLVEGRVQEFCVVGQVVVGNSGFRLTVQRGMARKADWE